MNLEIPWKESCFVAFDTETTGKYPLTSEIVEIAAVKWQGGKIVDEMSHLVRPKIEMSEDVIKIHGIQNEMVKDAPPIKQILPIFDDFIRGGILLGHNVGFDMGFLAPEYELFKLPLPKEVALDTSLLSRKLFPESINHKLITLIKFFDLNISTHHRALEDSQACLEVALRCFEKVGPNAKLSDIAKVQGEPFTWERYSLDSFSSDKVLGTLVRACREQLVIEIQYDGGTNKGRPRKVSPRGLVRNATGDFMVAVCHNDNSEKRFYLNRFISARILD